MTGASPDRPEKPGEGEAAGAPDHRDTGLDLARSVARSLAGGRATQRRGRRRAPRPDPQASGSYPDDRDPQTLDATLGRLVAEQGWGNDVRVHGVFARWDAIVGREVAQHVRPVSYVREEEGGSGPRLVVQTDSTAWATQMRLLAATVVRRLNQELGDGTVALIDVRGPSAPSWKHGRRSLRDGRGPRDTYG
ncbi:MAG: Zn-ribbon-containing, possibly RNA-binding protein and truncated derivatives [uncultured Nocardioidaceae bacterium]|uniref:Zn-ribbon-containing, possibly RNA-binding protein and truncated derivatives n=1 Tax=uncultured Nocardioidaceae bacterium TaxID=253824 RepID=A0A6J4L828_9ACTN|nr:MAG: Zn-ribbon-containing, possibly RNA-binding protein and truncated derivatives [uncultured Nocardioidaceae bacterium]